MNSRTRVDDAAAFVLHAYPYRETSLIVEAYSRAHGRLALVAKGARRPRSPIRGLLMAFQPLALGWAGRGEVRTLHRAEWLGGHPLLKGEALLCGFYLNELLLKMLPREDAHEALFDAYAAAIARLARDEQTAPVLRAFERQLLKELGYALALEREVASGAVLEEKRWYRYEPELGPVPIREGGGGDQESPSGPPAFTGRVLRDIAADDYRDPHTLAQSKRLMRLLINHRLDRQPLSRRRMFLDLAKL